MDLLELGLEGRNRESFAIGQVADGIVDPCIANEFRGRHDIAPDEDGVTVNSCISPNEMVVCSGYGKAFEFVAVGNNEAAANLLEMKADLRALEIS